MGRKPALTAIEKAKIDKLRDQGQNLMQIANAVGRSRHVIRNYIKLGQNYGIRTYKKRKGSLTERQKRLIRREASNSSASAAAIKEKLGIQASRRTVSRVLTSSSTVKQKKIKDKPPLRGKQKQARLELTAKTQNSNSQHAK